MENNNTMFGNQVSKKVVSKEVQIREQSASFLNDYNAKIKSLTEDAEQAKLDAAMSNARFGYAATTKRSNDRIRLMNETIAYENNAAIYGMAEMVSEIVESGLLLDESELEKICPDYKMDIRETVSGLLKDGRVNQEITNPDTLAIMEYVSKKLPGVKEGRSLTEEDIAGIVAKEKPLDIDMAIKNLGSNISDRVSGLLEKEQKQKKEIEAEVNDAKANAGIDTDGNGKDDLSEIEEAIANGELNQGDIDELLNNGEISEEEHAQLSDMIAQSASQPAEDEVPPEGEMPEEGEVPPEEMPAEQPGPEMGGQPAAPAGMPKKQVQLLPDGTMNINVYENVLVRETPCTGLFESLAVNEAKTMLSEGKEYDSDACLAKAIIYVTITEAMDELGLIDVTENDYNRIITEAGGCANPKNTKQICAKMRKKSANVPAKKEKGVAIKESVALNEFAVTSGPVMNTYGSDDFAERIRRRKLERQQTLTEDSKPE